PVDDYACQTCGQTTELLLKQPQENPPCHACGSRETKRKFSTFAIKTQGQKMYSDQFTESAIPFLKGQAPGLFEGSGSEEAKAHKLTEAIGKRVDKALGAGE